MQKKYHSRIFTEEIQNCSMKLSQGKAKFIMKKSTLANKPSCSVNSQESIFIIHRFVLKPEGTVRIT